MYCYPQMEQTDYPPQIGVSLVGRNVIKVSHKVKKILCPLTGSKLQIAIATVYRLPKPYFSAQKAYFERLNNAINWICRISACRYYSTGDFCERPLTLKSKVYAERSYSICKNGAHNRTYLFKLDRSSWAVRLEIAEKLFSDDMVAAYNVTSN